MTANSTLYPVFFNQGASGTFLVYLINLHNGFNQVELYKCYSKITDFDQVLDTLTSNTNKTVYHVMVDSASWRWTNNGNDPNPNIIPYSFDEWKEKAERRLGKGWTEKKLAIKMLPHDLVDESIKLITIKDYLTNMNPIVIKLGSKEFYNNWIVQRQIHNSLYSHSSTDSYEHMTSRMDKVTDEFEKMKVSYCVIDLEKMLNLDDNEYLKLVRYLDTQPIDDWKDQILNYKKLINMN